MDTRLKGLVDLTRAKFGLQNYHLERRQLLQRITLFNDTVYTLSMEWIPNQSVAHADDENPEGTAMIEIDVNTQKVKSVIFVHDKSFAHGIKFDEKQDMIKWVEQETGLVYRKQFQLQKDETNELSFNECVDGVVLSPSGWMEIKRDSQGNLTMFSAYVHASIEKQIKKDTYSLTLDKVEDLAKEQLLFSYLPLFEKQQIVPVYAIDEIYITNKHMATIHYGLIISDMNERPFIEIEKKMNWNKSFGELYERKEIQWGGGKEVTPEQAFSREPSQDSLPITKSEQEWCAESVEAFLSQQYPDDSGKWILNILYRDKGYIHAITTWTEKGKHPVQRRLTILIDRNSFHVCNFIDNKPMVDMINHFKAPEKITVAKDDAYAKLKSFLELKPYYVYDLKQKQYILCGKLDCEYAVNASGEGVVSINDLLH